MDLGSEWCQNMEYLVWVWNEAQGPERQGRQYVIVHQILEAGEDPGSLYSINEPPNGAEMGDRRENLNSGGDMQW